MRRVLLEAAWTYRFPARKTRTRQKRAERCDEKIQVIAWDAEKRLCHRYRHLTDGGKLKVQVVHGGGAGTGRIHLGDWSGRACADGQGQRQSVTKKYVSSSVLNAEQATKENP